MRELKSSLTRVEVSGREERAIETERDEVEAMHEAMRRIAAEVINDSDRSVRDDFGQWLKSIGDAACRAMFTHYSVHVNVQYMF